MGDIALAISALYAGSIVRFGSFQAFQGIEYIFGLHGAKTLLAIMIPIFSSFLLELYNNGNNTSKKELLIKVASGIVVSFVLLSVIYYLMPSLIIGRGVFLFFLSIFGFSQFIWHLTYKYCLSFPAFVQRVLIIGTGPLAKHIGKTITSTNHTYALAGYVDCSSETLFISPKGIIHNGRKILETVQDEKADKIVVSLTERRGALPLSELLSCKLNGIGVLDAPSFYEELTGKLLIENIQPSWLIFSDGFKTTFTKKIVKKIFDAVFAIIGSIIVFPLIPIIAFLIKIDSQGPVFLRQTRVGEKEKRFVLYKFRTMCQDAENKTGAVWTQKDDPRITRIGKILRKIRLDEIPQFYNVLKGDMSFIGPRPERPEFIEHLKKKIPYYAERHVVKPGITGWAQVKYSYGASTEDAIEKLRYDLFYIKHLTLFFDLLIILETIKVVIFGRGGR